MTIDSSWSVRPNLFATVHKGVRWWMGQVSAHLGAASFASSESDASAQDLGELLKALHEHAMHEDLFIAPLVATRGADRNLLWQDDHRRLDRLEGALKSQLDDLARLVRPHPMIEAIGTSLYRGFNRFAAETLVHLEHEESVIMPMLHATCTDAELMGVLARYLDRFGAEAALFHRRVAQAYTADERAKLKL